MIKIPFVSAAQEYALMINAPDVWKRWVALYGHAPGFKSYTKKHKSKDKSKSRRRKKKKRTYKRSRRRKH